MRVAPVGGGDVVVGAQRPDGSDGHGLLALVGVGDAPDAAGPVERGRLLLELADEAHPAEHPGELLAGQSGEPFQGGALETGGGAGKRRTRRLSERSCHAVS